MKAPTPERLRVAQELHDGIAQDLVGIGYSLDLLLAEESLTGSARHQIRKNRLEVNQLIEKVRREIYQLRKPEIHNLSQAIADFAASSATPIHASLSHVSLTDLQVEELTRIALELLRNAVAHARATEIYIDIYPLNNHTCLEVIDDGIGGIEMKEGHFGLIGLSERVESLGGSLHIESAQGTKVTVLI